MSNEKDKAPDRIWIDAAPHLIADATRHIYVEPPPSHFRGFNSVEYVRADLLTTARREARAEAFRDVGLTDREVTRIGSQIVGDVLAQMGVRGTREERHGADTIAAAWVARIVERITEERAAALEAAATTQKGENDG